MAKSPQPSNHLHGFMVEGRLMEMTRLVAMQFLRVVGDLPVAIAIVAGYIDQPNYSLAEFLGYSNCSSRNWHTNKLPTFGRNEISLDAAFETAFQDLPLKTNTSPIHSPLSIGSDPFHENIYSNSFCLDLSGKNIFSCILDRKWTTC